MSAITFRDQLAYYFKSRPNVWIDGMELSHVGGCYAYRTRISDVRRQLGMRILNRQRKVGRRVISEYCYCPEVQLGQADLFQGVSA